MNKRFADRDAIPDAIAKANYALHAKKYTVVLTIMQQALREHPGNCLALFFIAEVYAIQKNYPAALEMVQEALRQDPEYTGAHRLYGIILQNLGQYDQAEIEFQAAVGGNVVFAVTQAEVHHSYGEFLLQVRHDTVRAREHCLKALEANPKYLRAYRLLAQISIEEGDVQRAEEVYLDALRLEPNNGMLHSNYGVLMMQYRHDPRAAFEHFRIALMSDPANETYRQNFFLALKAKKRLYWYFWQYASFRRKLQWRYSVIVLAFALVMREFYATAKQGSLFLQVLYMVVVILFLLFFIYLYTINYIFNFLIKRGWIK
jgi:Tfp pilus assembly protein PilF